MIALKSTIIGLGCSINRTLFSGCTRKKALEIIHDDERLRVLGRNIATLAQHQSAERIVDEIVKIIEKKNL